ncbi:MAG: EAL domain-containing protein [Firmicutes bacterium]|nr:EAL domain-containing protein [Bacillota bacterium]
MLDSHVKFHSANGKRLILIVDDEEINREILGAILEDKYEILYAETGEEALELIKENRDNLSLVLLELILPGIHGFDVLREMKSDPVMGNIPVIVLTADKAAEVESLSLGAIDFISKPYPGQEIIDARVQKTIELSEDRDIISSTERDQVTGLYNKEYFYRYAEQFDKYHKELPMDAIVVNVNHFNMINERYGKEYGNEVLRTIGERLREAVIGSGGIVCRRESDVFMVYCPQRSDYDEILRKTSEGIDGIGSTSSRVHLRMGVYSHVDKSVDVEIRFDRAKIASDTVRNSYSKAIGLYDDKLHQSELFEEQLVEDFQKAIDEKEFIVNYQPKYDIRLSHPVMNSAEALVRWNHPEHGLISPGIFVPLFEENGLIQKLDFYVWREVASQMQDWKGRYGRSVPVSVNFSRIDLYEPNMVPYLRGLLDEYNLKADELLLEITESAYTEDSEQIVEMVGQLRREGFLIEMDDFGSGYSSLNMISTLPIDALKLDMMFIRNAFGTKQNTRIIEVIIDLAKHLKVPVIAEGVESEDQVKALKDLGCDIVQGYYFSKPVPASEYEELLSAEQQKDGDEAERSAHEGTEDAASKEDEHEDVSAAEVYAGGEETDRTGKAWEKADDTDKDEKGNKAFKLRALSFTFAIIAFIFAVCLSITDTMVNHGQEDLIKAQNRNIAARQAAADLEAASDYLTDEVRDFVVTGDTVHMNNFVSEVTEVKSRDKAVSDLEKLLKGNDSSMYTNLSRALALSNQLVEQENMAIKYTVMAGDYKDSQIPDVIKAIDPPAEALSMSPEQLKAAATEMIYGESYAAQKREIKSSTELCTQELVSISNEEVEKTEARMDKILDFQTVMTVLLILIIAMFLACIEKYIMKPLSDLVSAIGENKSVKPDGVSEIQYVSRAYNDMLEETRQSHEHLEYQALHDKLTGLLNRTAYEAMTPDIDLDNSALIMVDVDDFKTVNDTYGHDVGDLVLKKVASILKDSFRSVDQIYRLGGDEFVVVMMRVDSSHRDLVLNKIGKANQILSNPDDGLPKVTLSAGAAFGDRENPQGDIFKDADTALYRVKEAGRNGCQIF